MHRQLSRFSQSAKAQQAAAAALAARRMTGPPVHAPRAGKVGDPLVVGETTAEKLDRAQGYPYPRPPTSFVFVNGPSSSTGPTAHTFDNAAWVPPSRWQGSVDSLNSLQVTGPDGHTQQLADALSAAGVSPSVLDGSTPLTAILAIGSNAGPAQLARKFPLELFPQGVVVPVIQCVLRDFDVVYAPLISSYGSATATLEASPGTDVSMFITYLTPPLQQRMHETEGAYNLVKLEDIQLLEGLSLQQHMDGAAPVAVQGSVYQYNHQCGTLHLPFSNPGTRPVALWEIPAHNRVFPELSQVQMQAALRVALQGVTEDHLEAATDAGAAADLCAIPSASHIVAGCQDSSSEVSAELDDWILSNLQQHKLRRARVAALTKAALPFQYDRAEVMLVIGTEMSTSVK